MAPTPRTLRRRLIAIRNARPAVRRQAEVVVLAYYRTHRRLPRGPLCSVVGSKRLRQIVARGEVEHLLGIATAIRHLDRWRDRLTAVWKHRCVTRGLAEGRIRGKDSKPAAMTTSKTTIDMNRSRPDEP
jgi:hypothetical protein